MRRAERSIHVGGLAVDRVGGPEEFFSSPFFGTCVVFLAQKTLISSFSGSKNEQNNFFLQIVTKKGQKILKIINTLFF